MIKEISVVTAVASYLTAFNIFKLDRPTSYVSVERLLSLIDLYVTEHNNTIISFNDDDYKWAFDVTSGKIVRENNIITCRFISEEEYTKLADTELVDSFKSNSSRA